MKPGTRCTRCGNPFAEDEPLSAYCGTIKISIAKTNQSTDYDLCVICLANLVREIKGWGDDEND